MDILYLTRQIAEAQQRIAELRYEYGGLQSLKAQVASDSITFEGQVQRKRMSVGKSASVAHMKAANGFSEKMASELGPTFQDSVFSCFSGVNMQIDGAMRNVQEEIDVLRRRIFVLNEQVQYERRKEAQTP
jgi:hypothetical protein